MTLRWRYEIHRKDVGHSSLVASGGADSIREIADIAKANPLPVRAWRSPQINPSTSIY
jgi:hypothetical protein